MVTLDLINTVAFGGAILAGGLAGSMPGTTANAMADMEALVCVNLWT
jgi:hypothetical protein